MTHTPTTPIKLDAETVEFISYLHQSGPHRFTQEVSGNKTTTFWSRTNEPLRLPPGSVGAAIYFSIHPVTERVTDKDRAKHPGRADSSIEPYVAAKNRTVAGISAFFREYDAKDFTDPSPAEIEEQYRRLRAKPENTRKPEKGLRNEALGAAKSAKYKTDPEKYKAIALHHAEAHNPSVIVASGGGYQTYQLLDKPLVIRTSEHDYSAHIESYAADLQKRWVQSDPAADQKVHDLRRIFRVIGSINYKPAYGPNFPAVTFHKRDMANVASLTHAIEQLPPVAEPTAQPTKQEHAQICAPSQAESYHAGNSVIYAYNEATRIVDILEHCNYTHKDGRMMRPGGEQAGVDIDLATNRSRHWSSNDDLYSVYWRSPFDVFCTYEHNGDVNAAVKAAAAQLGMVRQRPDVTPVINVLRLYNKTHNIAARVGKGPGSKKIRPVLDCLCDRMQRRNSLAITDGKKGIARDAGVSPATVGNVLALLDGRIVDVNVTEFGHEITLVSNCRLQEFDPSLDIVLALSLGGQETENDKNEYSPHRADDAFASGTSRYQKDHIKDLAEALDLTYPQARDTYTHRGCGEGILLAYDTSLRIGDFTAQEYADETGLKLSSVRSPLNYAVKLGLATTERPGSRCPKIYSFAPDFWERIAELTPNLRTYKLFDQRENKRLESAQQWTQAEVAKAEAAGAKEKAAELQIRFKQQAEQRLPHLKSLYPGLSPAEIEDLAYKVAAYKRNPKTEAAIRTERSAQRTEHRETVALIRDLAVELADIDNPREDLYAKIKPYDFDDAMIRGVIQSPAQMAGLDFLGDLRKQAYAEGQQVYA